MQFIFDKGLSTEKSLEIDFYSEQVRNHKLTANYDRQIDSQSDFPDISGFSDEVTFTTLNVMDSGMSVPIIGKYNTISAFNASYSSVGRHFQINITLALSETK